MDIEKIRSVGVGDKYRGRGQSSVSLQYLPVDNACSGPEDTAVK